MLRYQRVCPSCSGPRHYNARICRKCSDAATGRVGNRLPCTACMCTLPKSSFRMRTRKVPRPRSVCKKCEANKQRERAKRHPERNEFNRRDWERRNPLKHRVHTIRHRCRLLGVRESDIPLVIATVLKDPRLCPVCLRKYHKRLSIDHCHRTGRFRGLICSDCNGGIGLLGDSASNLKRAVAYLTLTPLNA